MSIDPRQNGQDLLNVVDSAPDIGMFDGEKKFRKVQRKRKKKVVRRDESAHLIGSLHNSPSAASVKSLRSTIITGLDGRVKLTDKHEPLAQYEAENLVNRH